MFIVNYLQSLLSKGIQLKLAEILIISIEKTFAGIFLDRIALAPVMTQTFCGLTGKLNFRPLCHAPIKTKRVGSGKVPGSHQTCGRVSAIAILLKGKLLSLTIL